MKAIRVERPGEPDVMELCNCADLHPGHGELVIELKAAGVNPVDTYIRSGGQGYAPPRLPWTPGIDGAGRVREVGPGVERFETGDAVYLFGTLTGTYAEQALCSEAHVYPLPEGVSFEHGAAIGVPYGTAYRALFDRAQARPGERVLVHGGSGGVGLAAIQLAVGAGMDVYATAGSEDGQALARSAGALDVADHRQTGHLKTLIEENRLEGFDVILEMLADRNLGNDLPALARGGRVVVIGSRGRVEVTPRELMGRDAAVLGMSLLNAATEDLQRIHAALAAGLRNGVLKPVIGRSYPLAAAAEAHHTVMEQSALGKIVLLL